MEWAALIIAGHKEPLPLGAFDERTLPFVSCFDFLWYYVYGDEHAVSFYHRSNPLFISLNFQ